MNDMLKDLKPCPNCGSTDLSDHYVYIACNKCLMCGPKENRGVNDAHSDYIDHKMAVENWNDLPRREEKNNEPIIDSEKVIQVDPLIIKEGTSKPRKR